MQTRDLRETFKEMRTNGVAKPDTENGRKWVMLRKRNQVAFEKAMKSRLKAA